MQGVMGEQQCLVIGVGQRAGDEAQIPPLVAAVDLVPDNRVTGMLQMDSDLVLATRVRSRLDPADLAMLVAAAAEHFNVRTCGRAVVAHAVFDGDRTLLVAAERRIDREHIQCRVAVGECPVGLSNRARREQRAELAGHRRGLRNHDKTAGFSIEPVDEPAFAMSEMLPDAADETRQGTVLCRMTDESGRLVDDEKVVVFVEDIERLSAPRTGART